MPVIQEGMYNPFQTWAVCDILKKTLFCSLEYIPVSGIKESNYSSKVQPLHNLISKWFFFNPPYFKSTVNSTFRGIETNFDIHVQLIVTLQ